MRSAGNTEFQKSLKLDQEGLRHNENIDETCFIYYLLTSSLAGRLCNFLTSHDTPHILLTSKAESKLTQFICLLVDASRITQTPAWPGRAILSSRHVQRGVRWVLEHLPLFPVKPKVPFCQGDLLVKWINNLAVNKMIHMMTFHLPISPGRSLTFRQL